MDQTDTPATPASTYAEFSTVFDELMEPTSTPANTDTTTSPAALQAAADATPKTEPESETPVNPVSGESATPAVPAVAAEPPAPVVEGGEAGEAAAAGASQAATDWEAKYKELQAAQAAQAAAEATPPPPVQQQVQPAPQAAPEPELFNQEERAALAKFEEDWPDVARASSLKMRGELTAAVRHVFNEIKRVYDPLLTQALRSTAQLEDHTVVGEIRKGHTDYNDSLHAEVTAWVGTLKGMQRKVYEAVVDAGEPDEVIELITEFKKATGRAVPGIPAVVTPAATPAPMPGKVTNISEAAKKAAKAMGVVEGKRTATTAAADPNDFDAAWAEAIAEK